MLKDAVIIFLSIIIEATPFVLLGVFLSSLIQVFVSEDSLRRIIPRSIWKGLLIASLTGLVFPACECGIIPITRRLIKKGVPSYIAITFMLAVPIINPVVAVSTYFAFSGDLGFVLLRLLLGFAVSVAVGYTIYRLHGSRTALREGLAGAFAMDETPCGCSGCGCGAGSACGHTPSSAGVVAEKARAVLEHAGHDFFYVMQFLVIGSMLASLTHVFVPREQLLAVGGGTLSSIVTLMGFAFLISLCSEADAFVAATFVNSFSGASIVAFMVFGPMLDIKNLLMMSAVFRRRVLFLIVTLVTVYVLAGSIYLTFLGSF